MNKISRCFLLASLGLSSIAYSHDGCFYKYDNQYLGVGAVRYTIEGDMLCSKLPDGEYVWVNASEFDKSGGCWAGDKYPIGAIRETGGILQQCTISEEGFTEWVDYKKS